MRLPAVKPLVKFCAFGLAATLVFGCDSETHQADKEIQRRLDEAVADRAVNTEQTTNEARQKLEEVSKKTGGSAGTRAQLSATRAELLVDAALDLIRRIDQEELKLARASFNLGQLALQLDSGSVMITGYSKYDPKAAREHIDQQVAAAQGGPDKPTWEYEGVQMATVAAVKQKISELEGSLAKLQDEAKALTDQRNTTMSEAEAAFAASDAAQGQGSVDKFKEASGLRKKAGDLFIQIEKLNAQMVPVQRDLEIQQEQLKIVEDIVAQLQAQSQTLDAGWKSILQQIDQQNALAKQIVGPGSGGAASSGSALEDDGATIAEKAAHINQKATEIRALRQQAQGNLDDAAKLFGDAYRDSENMRRELQIKISNAGNAQNRADVQVWQAMTQIINPQSYRLREGATRRMLGALFASEAASLVSRVNLQASVSPIIQRAGANVPAELTPGNLSRDAETAINLADQAYTAADDVLKNIIEGTADKPSKDAARIERVLTFYGWAQVDKLAGKNTAAQDHLQQAVAQRNAAVEDNVKLPALPAELGVPPVKPTEGAAPATAPATAPTTEPTTAPAEPATKPG